MPRHTFSLLFAAAGILSITVAASEVTFVSGGNSPLTAGTGPAGVSVADFNKDGIQDLLVVNQNSADMSVFFGVGNGTFGAPASYATGGGGRFACVGDFNGDKYPDVAVCKPATSATAILLNNGSGAFLKYKDITTDDTPYSVITFDFNQDDKLDLAVASNGLGACIYLGNGDGTFGVRTAFTAGSNVIDIAAGRFDGDDILDLAVVNQDSDSVSILIGLGDGTFADAVDYDTDDNPYGITVGDLNNDSIPDLAISQIQLSSIKVLYGDGSGGFSTSSSFATDGSTPCSSVIADLNGDGRADLAVANANGSSFKVLLGTQSGLNSDGLVSIPSGTFQIALGDFNGDGRTDIVSANFSGENVSVLLNTTTRAQTVQFAPLSDKVFGDAPFQLSATASSGLPVSFSVLGGPATVTGNTVTLTGTGTVTIRASQAGVGFLGEAHIDRVFSVAKGTPVIMWNTPAPIPVGRPLDSAQLSATVNVQGTLEYIPPLGTQLGLGDNQALSCIFTPANINNYNTVAATVKINIVAPGTTPSGNSDSDGDGFSDAMEIASGSSPSDLKDRPFGLGINPTSLTLANADLSVTLNFAHVGKDRIYAAGQVVTASTTASDLTPFAIEVGGIAKLFQLSPKGKATSGKDSLRLAPLKGNVASLFKMTLRNGNFAAPLVAYGMANATNVKQTITIPMTVIYGGKVYTVSILESYTSKFGKAGVAKAK